jgi:UDP-N-acetyl-D-mannosaminuronic acid dehydrogenase
MDVSIIGGAGHVGLPLGLVLTDAGHDVTIIDKNEKLLESIEDGSFPYYEPGAETLLDDALAADKLDLTTEISAISDSEIVIIVIGTPIDEHNNPEIRNLLNLTVEARPYLQEDQLVLLRSTVYPGTTKRVRDRIEKGPLTVGEDLHLAFTPERISQHNSLKEIINFPQLVGSFSDTGYAVAETFFETFIHADCLRLTPTESEIGKLFTNMWRYISFAVANEFYLIVEEFARDHDVNVHRILNKTGREYPRFDVPDPGPNVGGPCLTKDGWFLADKIPYNEFVSTSFQVNEGMPAQIIDRMSRMEPNPEKVTILGMTFKRDSDDIRNSVSFKLEKQLELNGVTNIVEIEPNVEGFDSWDDVRDSDWVILMTNHSAFDDLKPIFDSVDNPDCLFCDIWGMWEAAKYDSDNGYFYSSEINI